MSEQGMVLNVPGPTLATMERLLQSDTKTISYNFTSCSLGILAGAIVCGITFERFNQELLLGIFGLVQAVAIASAPWTGSLYGYIGLMFFVGLGGGFTNSGGTAYSLTLWGNHRIRRPFLQTVHLMWSVGSTVSPFIARAFLHPFEESLSPNTTVMIRNDSASVENNTTLQWEVNTTSLQMENKAIVKVHFAYLCAGALSMLSGLLFILLFAFSGCKMVSVKEDLDLGTENVLKDKSAYSDMFRIKMLALMCLFYFFYLGYETPVRALLSIFAVKYLNWDVRKGALLNSAFFGAMVIGRLINALVSAFLKPKTMLILNFTGTILGFVLFLFVKYHDVVVWLSVALAGYSMSSTFATGVLWTSRYIQVTGTASSIFIVGCSIASMLFPPFVGFLFQTFSPMWFVYIVLASSFCHCVLFVGIEAYAIRHLKRLTKNDTSQKDLDS